ncbi:MAG: hypothetical protein AAF367_18845 [Pseudomonadota bacterium]
MPKYKRTKLGELHRVETVPTFLEKLQEVVARFVFAAIIIVVLYNVLT